MPDSDGPVTIEGEGGEVSFTPPSHEEKQEADQSLKEYIHSQAQEVVDADGRRRRVAPAGKVRDFVLSLIDKYGGKSCAEHIKEIVKWKDLYAEERAAREAAERALAEAREKSGAERAEWEKRLAEARGAAEAEWRERVTRLETRIRELEERLGKLDAIIAGKDARILELETELAAALARIRELETMAAALDADKRSKADLLKRIAELEARIVELEVALDYFDLEEEFDSAAVEARAKAAAQRLGASPDAPRQALGRESSDAGLDAAAAMKRFDALREVMEANKGSIAVVVDLVKNLKDAEAARGRLDLAERAAGE